MAQKHIKKSKAEFNPKKALPQPKERKVRGAAALAKKKTAKRKPTKK